VSRKDVIFSKGKVKMLIRIIGWFSPPLTHSLPLGSLSSFNIV